MLSSIATVLERTHTFELAPFGLKRSHFRVLMVLRRAGKAISMGEVARRVSVRPPNLTTDVDTLIARGYVMRNPAARDRRTALLCLTDSGQKFLDDYLPGHDKKMQELLRGLTASEQRQLGGLLSKVLAGLGSSPDDENVSPKFQ